MKLTYARQTAIFIVATFLIVWLMPRTSTSAYLYEVNRPWNYKLLTAPFDIPVQLDSVSAKELCDSIDEAFVPVYSRSQADAENMMVRAREALQTVSGVNGATRSKVLHALNELLSDGIVDEQTYTDIAAGRLKSIRLVRGNTVTYAPVSNLRSPLKAYEQLKQKLPAEEARYAIEQSKLAQILVPNVIFDTNTNERMRADLHRRVTAPTGVIQQGERIIDRGDIVTLQLYTILRTYEQMQAERGNDNGGNLLYAWGARLLYVGLLIGLLATFLYSFRRRLFVQSKVCLFLALCVMLFCVFAFIINQTFASGIYIVPFALVPILIVVFFDGRTALFTHVVTILIAAVVAPYPLEFVAVQFVAGAVAINSLRELSRRSQLLRSAIMVFICSALAYTAINLMLTGAVASLSARVYGFCAISAIFISFAYILILVFERTFGFTSMVALVELSDINHPVLRELSRECPGTFQHCMAVSNLAAEAAAKIDANVQLVRAGALYHDIGKINNPAFFTENQHGVNPHDALDPMQSARIIISHVTDGLKRAEKEKLPHVIRDFIAEHHGRGTARFFYISWCNAHPDQTDPAPFTYPGPNPTSAETSILMMADCVEAASRSLKDYSPESISDLVSKIIDGQLAEGLHADSPLRMRDVKVIKDTFIQRLQTIYHTRIAYPDAKK